MTSRFQAADYVVSRSHGTTQAIALTDGQYHALASIYAVEPIDPSDPSVLWRHPIEPLALAAPPCTQAAALQLQPLLCVPFEPVAMAAPP